MLIFDGYHIDVFGIIASVIGRIDAITYFCNSRQISSDILSSKINT